MRQNRAVIGFERDILNSLVQDENACVELKEQNYHFALHPFHLTNIKGSVQDILNQGISNYDKKLGGILLGYQDIKLLSSAGAVSNDSFFIHIDVAAAFFLFKPEVGKILTGTVNKKSKDHVGCLVHKMFNVSLPKPEKDDDWLGTKVEIGQDILFRITFTQLDARLPYIRAEFVSILSEQDSGISTSEENTDGKPKKIRFDSNSENEDAVNTLVKKHKKKRKREAVDEVDNLAADEEESPKVRKKKHKNRSREEAKDRIEDDAENNEEIVKKSRHKHKKHSFENEELEQKSFDKKKKYRTEDGAENNEEIVKKSRHKHKKHSFENEELEQKSFDKKKKYKTEDGAENNEEIVKKSRHKHKKHFFEDEELEHKSFDKKKKSKHKRVSETLDFDFSAIHENTKTTEVDNEDDIESDIRIKKKRKSNELEIETEHSKLENVKSSEEYNEIGSSSTKKKHKHKRDSLEKTEKIEDTDFKKNLNETFQKSKKGKKSKHKDSLQDLQDAILEKAFQSFTETTETNKKDKKHKSKSKKRLSQTDPDVSLPELNLSSLFSENVNKELKARSVLMADNEDKAVKPFSSTSRTALYEDKMPELPPDSDLEDILSSVGKKHKRRSHEEKTVTSRKRKRSTCSDDVETPKVKKKHK